jgi:hypothetical protein
MNYSLITAIAAVVAAAALVVFLPMLVGELRAATRQRKLAAYHSVMATADASSAFIAREHSSADLWWRASKGVENLTDVERVRYFAILFITFRAWERAFHFRNKEAGENLDVEIVTRPMKDLAMSNGVQEYWAMRKRWFTPEFRDWVDKQVKERAGVDVYGEQFRTFGSVDERPPEQEDRA